MPVLPAIFTSLQLPVAALPALFTDYLSAWIGGFIVVAGLFAYGLGDLLRFSPVRVWALSGVCFDESIRRRVLWLAPLAMLGVMIVAGLQHPNDEQDAVRVTTKICLFASGVVVVLTTIILACTNLPKEIENRVIYTVVSKPTTRLEIIAGKVLGFARVSAAILLIMGVFTYGYVSIRAWSLSADIAARLQSGVVDPTQVQNLQHLQSAGLLTAETLDFPDDVQIYSRVPEPGSDRRYMFALDQDFVLPFDYTDQLESLKPVGADPDLPAGGGGLYVVVNVGYVPSSAPQVEETPTPVVPPKGKLPETVAAPPAEPATAPSTAPTTAPAKQPGVRVTIMDARLNDLIGADQVNGGKPLFLPDPTGKTPLIVPIPPEAAVNIVKSPMFFVNVTGLDSKYEYFAEGNPVSIVVPSENQSDVRTLLPRYRRVRSTPIPPIFRGREGARSSMQIRGGPGVVPVAVYRFRNAPPPAVRDGMASFEMRLNVERSGETDEEVPTAAEIIVSNHNQFTGVVESAPITVHPESGRLLFFSVPQDVVKGGNFDVRIKARTAEHFLGLAGNSVQLVVGSNWFIFNLFKSLLVLWLLSILVIIISIFASTWLSWPIAIVLTIVMLMGHWAVEQLSDSLQPGIGNGMADLFGTRNAAVARTISGTFEALARALNILSNFLPDISRFSAIEDIERGLTIPSVVLLDSLLVLLMFGLPVMVLSYVILRNKEVAP